MSTTRASKPTVRRPTSAAQVPTHVAKAIADARTDMAVSSARADLARFAQYYEGVACEHIDAVAARVAKALWDLEPSTVTTTLTNEHSLHSYCTLPGRAGYVNVSVIFYPGADPFDADDPYGDNTLIQQFDVEGTYQRGADAPLLAALAQLQAGRLD